MNVQLCTFTLVGLLAPGVAVRVYTIASLIHCGPVTPKPDLTSSTISYGSPCAAKRAFAAGDSAASAHA